MAVAGMPLGKLSVAPSSWIPGGISSSWRVSGAGIRRRLVVLEQSRRKSDARIICSASFSPSVPSPPSSASPPVPYLSDIFWPSAGAFVSMAAMSVVDKHLQSRGLTFLIAPFGAVCCVLFATPNAPSARRYNVLMAHTGCALIGVLALAAFGPGWLARSVALAASVAFMEFTNSLHPPAAGLPLLFIDGPKFHALQWKYILFPSTLGCIFLLLVQEAVKFLKAKAKF